MSTDNTTGTTASMRSSVGDAVGLSQRPRWLVAVVGNNTEKRSAKRLADAGYDVYVATQRECRVWRDGRKALVDRVVIPTVVFVRCRDDERAALLAMPYIHRFLPDRARRVGNAPSPVAVVPDYDIDRLRFILGNSSVPVFFDNRTFQRGQRVRVLRGSLRGLIGEVMRDNDAGAELLIRLEVLGCARCSIAPEDCEMC